MALGDRRLVVVVVFCVAVAVVVVSSLYRVSLTTQAVELFAREPGEIRGAALDGTFVYWGNEKKQIRRKAK